ncbi:MAG TPA: hypothetical protein VMV89_02945 [Candidatus Paceibacterota bacterium]|nr:hypothetical protein [Candidatus Paceibacterota bacterium]
MNRSPLAARPMRARNVTPAKWSKQYRRMKIITAHEPGAVEGDANSSEDDSNQNA